MPNPIKDKNGKTIEIFVRLKQLMEEDGRPIALQLGLAGIPRSNFYSIKHGGDISAKLLCKFADLYNVSTDYLLGRTEERRINERNPAQGVHPAVPDAQGDTHESWIQRGAKVHEGD